MLFNILHKKTKEKKNEKAKEKMGDKERKGK